MSQPNKLLYDEVSPFASGEQYRADGWREIPEIIHDETQVKGFFGEYRFLSNFWPAAVMLDSVVYDSVEKAYQAAKWRPEDRSYFQACTNKEAIVYNREHMPNGYSAEEWDARKVDTMRSLLRQKYDPSINPENTADLLQTNECYLEETNWWNDTFWGRNLSGEGRNQLGQLLMEIRTSLAVAATEQEHSQVD